MGVPSPIAAVIVLSVEEREQLEAWVRRPSSAQALAMRARIVLAAAEGLSNTEIAQRYRARAVDGAQVAQSVRARSSGRLIG